MRTNSAFSPTSKRRHGFPSEAHVRRGRRIVHGEKELLEKLGRRDRCPCGSGRRFSCTAACAAAVSMAPGVTTTFRDQ